MAEKNQEYDLAFTHLRNNQNISAYNLFTNLAESYKNSDEPKSALLYLLAAECKSRQKKDNNEEFLMAANLYQNFAKKDKSYNSKSAYLCASKCFLKTGRYSEAKKAFNKSKEISSPQISFMRPVIIIEDSKAITMKLEKYLERLGYSTFYSFENGKDGIKKCKELISDSHNPIVLLDMGLPDVGGDVVASTLLKEKLDLQIIIITADEKTSKRVNKTISSGVASFIQKPFTIDEVKKAIDIAESEY